MEAVVTRGVTAADLESLVSLTAGAGAFRPAEVAVAREVLTAVLDGGDASGYRCAVARDPASSGRVLGYAVWGPTPCTDGTFDLYWLAVERAARGRGVASRLLSVAEESARDEGGRQLVVETSGGPRYAAARRFYERRGFREVARVPDFYRPDDPKVVYLKSLPPNG